jgi:hypothetical protein
MRDGLHAEERIPVTLRYLPTRKSYEDLKLSAAIVPQVLGRIITGKCTAIYEAPAGSYRKGNVNFSSNVINRMLFA